MTIDEIDNGLVSVIDFTSLYVARIEEQFLADIERFGLKEHKVTADVKRLLYHHIIYGVCEYVKSQPIKQKCIIYFCSSDQLNTQTCELFDKSIRKATDKVIRDIKNKLPIRIYITKTPFNYYINLKESNKNRGIEILEDLTLYADKEQLKYTFNKIKTYALRNGLTFLTQKYFNSITNRMLVVK